MRKVIYKIVVFVVVIGVMASCQDKRKSNYQYMPNMYEPVPYETYSTNPNFAPGMEGRLPVDGTLARGSEMPYEYENSDAGYELAKLELKNPLDSLAIDSERGESLYMIYCSSCHGDKGDGQGELVKREKFLGIPNYKDRDITEGSIYHVIMYGKNMMGSHSSQLTEEERWQVTAYVQELRNN